jgi:(E)-2-((N-methylformamido)methylene)succinate hydrolase
MISTTLPASDGRLIGLIEAGQGVPLVLFHGVGMCARAWEPQLAALGTGRRVIALDLPGHGATPTLPGTPGLPDYVAWASGAIVALGLGPVAVAGHSMGALIALGLTVEHPEQVSQLCLLNPVYQRDETARAAVLNRARSLAEGRSDPEAPLSRWFAPGEAPEVRAKVAEWLHAVDPVGYCRTYSAFATGDAVYAGRLGEIRCPTLVLTGEGDHNSSPAMTRQIAQDIDGARAVIIAGERHMVSLTAPARVNQEMALWLGLDAAQGVSA